MINSKVKKLFTLILVTTPLLGYSCNNKNFAKDTIIKAKNPLCIETNALAKANVNDNFNGLFVKENTIISGLQYINSKDSSVSTYLTKVLYNANNKNLYVAEGTLFYIHIETQSNLTPDIKQVQVSILKHKPSLKKHESFATVQVKKPNYTSNTVFIAAGKGIWKHSFYATATLQQGLSFINAKLEIFKTPIQEYFFLESFAPDTKLTNKVQNNKKHYQQHSFSLPPPDLFCFLKPSLFQLS